jgi:hypothetical protein
MVHKRHHREITWSSKKIDFNLNPEAFLGLSEAYYRRGRQHFPTAVTVAIRVFFFEERGYIVDIPVHAPKGAN